MDDNYAIFLPIFILVVYIGDSGRKTLRKNRVFQAFHDKLNRRELHYAFGVSDPAHLPEYDLIRPKNEHDSGGRLHRMRFDAWNTTYVVELQPNKLISPHLVRRILPTGVKPDN